MASDVARFGLPADEVHVWSVWLDASEPLVNRLGGLLSDDERARAARFRFDRDRDRYVVGRGALRILLGRYLDCDPRAPRFRYGEHDKPFLAGEGPWFNVSHSGPRALIGFSAAAELGIDIERLGVERIDLERIAERFFSPSEVRTLRSMPDELRARAFLNCWTRKEAFIKARGDGLSLALDSFDVTLAPWEPVALTRTAWSAEEPGQWRLVDLSDPQGEFVAAVALRGGSWRVISRDAAGVIENE